MTARALLACLLCLATACTQDAQPSSDEDAPGDTLDAREPTDGGPPRLDRGPPTGCDQPDAPSCEVAGCVWSELGCTALDRAPCARLPVDLCEARRECLWGPAGCALDVEAAECALLDLDQCETRADCGFGQGRCQTAPEGSCAELVGAQCVLRRDCVAEPPPGCSCDGTRTKAPDAAVANVAECQEAADCPQGDVCSEARCVSCCALTFRRCTTPEDARLDAGVDVDAGG